MFRLVGLFLGTPTTQWAQEKYKNLWTDITAPGPKMVANASKNQIFG